MKKNFLFILSLAVICFLSCTKESKKTAPPILTLGTSASDSYFPVSTGSIWQYNLQSTDFAYQEGITIKMLGKDSTIGSQLFHAASCSYTALNGAISIDTADFYSDNNHVYGFRFYDNAMGLFNVKVLNDTMAVGHSFISTATDNGFWHSIPVRGFTTIRAKDSTMAVTGYTFKNVIHSQVDIQFLTDGRIIHLATINFYLAKGVGIIQYDFVLDNKVHQSHVNIYSYSIK